MKNTLINLEQAEFLKSLPGFEKEEQFDNMMIYSYNRGDSKIQIYSNGDGTWGHTLERKMEKKIGNMSYSNYTQSTISGVSFEALKDTLSDILHLKDGGK